MKKFIAIAMFLSLLSILILACATTSSSQKTEAQSQANTEAQQARKDSLDMQVKIELSLGMEYYKNGQYTDAIPHFKKIINELAPEETRAWKYLADSYFRLDMPDSAFDTYKAGIEKFPEMSYLHRGIALLYQKKAAAGEKSFLDSALVEYETAFELDDKEAFSAAQIGLILLSRGMLDSSIVWFENSAKADSNQVEIWEKLAELFSVRGNWNGVRRAYENLVRIDPENTDYALSLGRAQANTGEYENAVATIEAYIEANPNDYKGYRYMGLIHSAKGKYVLKAEKLAPDNVKLLLDIADTYVDMKSFGSASKYLRKARAIDPKSCRAIVTEGNICVGRARNKVPEEGVGVEDKLRFECCYQIYRRAVSQRCDIWADVARMKLKYLDQFMPTAQEKKEFFFIHPELKGKICE